MFKQNNSIFHVANSCISIEDIYAAEKNLQSVVKKTELIESPVFSNECGNLVFIKPENLQVTGAFKIRGAFNKLSKLSNEEKGRGVIASSAGNHAQGVGYAAQILGIKATVVMPATTPIIKVEATKNYGATVVLYGDSYDEAYKKARELEAEHNYVFVHPFDDLDVILGQGTVALEILNELEDVDEILVPIGGGGLASGIAFAAKMLKPSIRIIGVEPEGACCMKESLTNNQVIELDKVDTIADGAAVKRAGTLTFEFIREFVDEVIAVSDFDIAEAILLLIEKHKLITEGAGALSLAGLKKISSRNKKVVCLVSGGNIDILTISAIINKALVFRGRLFCFTINLPDKPGELLHVAKIISELNANVIKLDHNQSKVMDSFKQVQLEVTVETNGHSHVEEIEAAFLRNGIDIQKIY
ncbi:threonine ammonia-lyase [Pelosinus propionicus]|uniref:L-threonine dehydratase catabolic TdcB n=1 Tax=Pelosinus propionicus DSM 13327 TaxID=1123291 RepID=A0A1I4M8Q5_9FIRM|nr:threonine ammonia-lyase [Pelosinus propionicus]SFL99337.1 L-threonine ammonia-lyase [Pelosinus propionicus DSM 13327]